VAGGDPGVVEVDSSVELYDPITETWSQTGSMINPRSNHTATLLLSGEVLVVGGGALACLGGVRPDHGSVASDRLAARRQ
jgi:hypothetical protein